MPVDKFGKTDVGTMQRIVSGGVTLSQINNTFLRRDGENTASADIDMDGKAIKNLSLPDKQTDAANKQYVDNRTLLPSRKFLAPYATDLNKYIWKDFQMIPPGLSESLFDELPAGFYACFTNYIPPARLGDLPANRKGYLITLTYQQPVDRNKYYKWINSTNGDEWEAYFKNGIWKTWNMSSKVSKSYSGYIPILEANVSRLGFVASASSAINDTNNTYKPYGAFNNLNADGANGSWVSSSATGWLQIMCPEAVTIWRVALKARNIAERNITAWNITGSNDGTTFTPLLTSRIVLLGDATAPLFFNIPTTSAYQYYRFNITASTGPVDVGVQVMQLYVLTTG